MHKTEKTFGASTTALREAGYLLRVLLPLIPPGAKIDHRANVNSKMLGKIPGRFIAGGDPETDEGTWAALRSWQDGLSEKDQETAKSWPTENVGLLAEEYPGLDVDVNSADARDLVMRVVEDHLDCTGPMRTRAGAPRCLIPFRLKGEPFGKFRLEFRDTDGKDHAVELLARGQQYVVAGVHPSGAPYQWSRGGLADQSSMDLPALSRTVAEAFFGRLVEAINARGWKPLKYSTQHNGGKQPSTLIECIDPPYPPELAIAALRLMPNTFENFPSRDDLVKVTAEFKAATGRYAEEFRADFLDWCEDGDFAGQCDFEAIWQSMPTVHARPSALFERARAYGFRQDVLQDFAYLGHKSSSEIDTTLETLPGWLVEMNQRYALLSGEGCSAKMNILVTCKADQFRVEENAKIRDELRNRRVVLGAKRDGSPLMKPIFEAWLEHPKRRTYPQGLKFMPGQPPELDGRFNTWRGWGITPVAGDWSTIEHHIRYVLCGGNNDVAEYVLNWMALRYQRPHSAMGVCLVFRSAPGVGKSTVGNWLRTISGSAMMTVTQPDQLAGRFTPHLRDVHLIIAEEAIFSGNHAIRGPLKSLITDTTLTVEGKFLPVQEVANNVGLIMFSNEAWVAPVEMGDRRFMVVECAPKQEPGYYTELYDRAPVELPAFFDALLKRDLTKFSIWNFPKTEARSEQIAQTLSGADRIVYELLRDETLPDPHYRLNGEKRWDSAGWWGEPFHVPKSSMRKHANDHSGKHLRGRSITDKELKSALERAGVQGKRISLPDGTRPWCWEFPKLGEARKEFGRRLGFPLQWGDEP